MQCRIDVNNGNHVVRLADEVEWPQGLQRSGCTLPASLVLTVGGFDLLNPFAYPSAGGPDVPEQAIQDRAMEGILLCLISHGRT
jgi:hypothetical protein